MKRLLAFVAACLLLAACSSRPDCTFENRNGRLVPLGDCDNCPSFSIRQPDGRITPMGETEMAQYVQQNPPTVNYVPGTSRETLSDLFLYNYLLSGARAPYYSNIYVPQTRIYHTYRYEHPDWRPRGRDYNYGRYGSGTTIRNTTVNNYGSAAATPTSTRPTRASAYATPTTPTTKPVTPPIARASTPIPGTSYRSSGLSSYRASTPTPAAPVATKTPLSARSEFSRSTPAPSSYRSSYSPSTPTPSSYRSSYSAPGRSSYSSPSPTRSSYSAPSRSSSSYSAPSRSSYSSSSRPSSSYSSSRSYSAGRH